MRRSVTTKRNEIMISDCGMYCAAPGHSRRGDDRSEPLRSIMLEAGDRKRPPWVDLTVREENVTRVHAPSTVSIVEGANIRPRGDRSLWESAQAVFLDVRLTREFRLNASSVVRTGALEETYMDA